MIIEQLRNIVGRQETLVNSIPFISYDSSCSDIDDRISAWKVVGMWASGVRLSLRCLLNDADFLISQVVELVDELVDLLVSHFDLTLEGFLVV